MEYSERIEIVVPLRDRVLLLRVLIKELQKSAQVFLNNYFTVHLLYFNKYIVLQVLKNANKEDAIFLET